MHTEFANDGGLQCEKCGNKIGSYINVGGEELVVIDGVVLRTFHGACARCGNPLHWSLADNAIRRLISTSRASGKPEQRG